MAEQQLPDINIQINELPFDKETKNKLFYAFYDENPRKAFESIKGVPLNIKQAMFDIRGRIHRGEKYDIDDIVRAVPVEQRKPLSLTDETVVGTEKTGAIPSVKPKIPKVEEVESESIAKRAARIALGPAFSMTKSEEDKPKYKQKEPVASVSKKETKAAPAPAPATAPPPAVAEPKTAEPPAPLLSREEMESRYANYIKEQAEKAEKALREKQPKGKVDKGKDSTAKKYQDIQIQAEEIAAPPSPVIVLNPYKPGTPEYEEERKRSAQTPVEVVQGPAKSFSEGLGQTIEYSVEQVPKTAKALSKAAAASEPGGKEYVTKKELLESGKTMREPLARPELLVPGGDGRKDLTREFVRGTLEAVGGLTAPETIAVVAGTKGLGTAAGLATGITRSALKAATSALSAYFTGQAGVSAYEKGKEAVELYEKGDYTGAARALGVGSIDALFALMGAAHSGKKATESFKEGYARGQRRRANVETGFEDKFQKAVGEDFEPVPGQPGMLRLKKKPTAPAAGELPAAGEPKPATAKERSIIEYYKEDPTGVYDKLTGDIEKKTAELTQASKYKDSNKNKIKKLGKELDALNKQKALIDRLRQGEEVEQPVAPPPVVATEPAQPPLAISAEPPPVAGEAPVVEPPPVAEPTPAAAEPVKAAVEPTVKPTVAETFSTPGGVKITDITQTSPEGFTPGIDYIPETDFIFDVEGIGKFTVIPSTEKLGSFAIWPEGDIAPAAVVEGANAKEAFTSFIDKPAPEVKVEAPVTPTGATEAPPAPGVTAPTTKPPVEEPKAATEAPPPVVAAVPPMPAPAPVQPPTPPVAPKPVEKKSPPPDRRSMIQRGMNDPVTVFFKDSRDKSLFDAESKLSGALRGRKEYSSDVIKNLENYGNYFSEKLGIQPQETRSLIARYRQMVIDRAKAMPKAEPDVLEVPSFIEFAKAEIEAAKAKETPAPVAPPTPEPSPNQPVPPEPIKPPAAPKPPAESPKAATEPPQGYTPEADGKVYVWMDYIGSDGKLSRKPVFLSSAEKSKVWISLLQHFGRLIDKERKLPESMRIYFTGGILPGGKLAKPNRNTPYTDINTSYVEDLAKAMKRDKGEPNYQERVDNAIQKLQSLFDIPATVPAEKPKGGTGKKTKKGEAPVPESPAEPAPTQPQPPVELTPKPPVTPSEPGEEPVAIRRKTPKPVEPSEKEIQQEERALEIIPLSELPKKSFRLSEKEEDKSNRVVTTYNGDTWHTNYHVLVKGEPPKYWDKDTIANKGNLGLNQILPDSSSKFKPVEPMAYRYWQKKDESGKTPKLVPSRAVLMSDGGAIDADYYRYIVDTVKPDSWQRGKQDGSYAAYKNGQPVAVVMNLRGVGQYSKESLASALKNRSNFRQKQTWEMSESELLKRQSENPGNPEYDKATRKHDSHAEIVSKAILSGKPVPEYVVEGMGGKFFYVSNPIYEKLYPNGSEQFEAKEAFRNKSKPIVLDYLERLREGENPGDIYEFVKSKLEPGPNPPGFTPAPPELPKPKDKPAAESKKSPAKASEEIKADDIEEIGISGEGEIEFAYKGKRYQASPIFDGKGYRFYDMESGKNIGEFKKSSYLEDPKEALAEILDADRQLKELSGDAETPEVKPEKSEVAPVEIPKIQTKYIEPKTPQYREYDNLIALKLRSDRNPVIWMNQKSKLNIFEALERNGIRGFDPTSLGTNFNKASNFYSLLDAVLAKPVGMFKGSQKQRDLLVALRDAMQEARAFSVLNGKDGGVSLINVDSPGREVLISPESYKAFESKPESVKKFHRIFKVGAVGDLIRTFRHENVHAEMSTAVKSIPKADMGTLFKNPSIVEFSSILQRKGYSGADPYTVINELTAHVLTGDFDFFSSNGMTAESLVNAYSVVRPYILAIDKDAVVRAERFKKPGLKISESEPAKLSGTAEQTFSPNLNEITGAMFSTQPPPGRSVKPKANVQSNDLIEEVVKTTEEQQNFLDKVIESTYGKYSPKQQSLLEKIVEQQLSIPKERGESEMSTRIPLSKKAKEDVAKDVLVIGLNSIAENPKMLNTVIEKMTVARDKEGKKIYHGLSGLNLAEGDPIKSAKQIMDRMVDNLLWLHDKMPKEQRDRAKLWYDGANKLINKWSKEYSADPQAVAGVIAVLSPQKDWYQNAEMARKILEAYKKRSSLKWNPKMDEFLFSKDALVENGEAEGLNDEGASIEDIIAKEERIKKSSSNFYKAAQKIKGKDFNELTSTYEKAVWLRAYDEVTSDRSFRILLPEGKFGDIAVIESGKNKGQRMKMAWQSYAAIEKAIDIMENDSYENISEKLGTKHKVRNFYNNMLFPNSKNGHVTIDTHAVAAALLQPLSSSNVEVNDNFGGISSASTGSQGTYGLIAEAYRKAAAKRGLLAREMQSITWEAVRGLFEAKFKQQDSNKKAINDIWNKMEESKKSDINKIREEILKTAGGMRKPSWVGQGLRTAPPPKKK